MRKSSSGANYQSALIKALATLFSIPFSFCVSVRGEVDLEAYRIPLSALERSEALVASGQGEEGRQVAHILFDTARKEFDAGDQSAVIFYIMGKSAAIVGNRSMAIDYLKKSIAQEPAFLDSRIALAKAYLSIGYSMAAIETFEAAEKYFEGSRRYRLFLAELYAQDSQYSKAVSLVEREISNSPEDLSVASFLISLYGRSDRAEDAIALLNRLQEKGTLSETEKLLRLTSLQLDLGDLRSARQSLQRARASDSEHPALDSHFARYYEASGDEAIADDQLSRAILFWERSLEFEASRVSTRRKLGSAYASEGDYEKALEYLSGLLESKPEDPEFYLEIAKALHATGKQQSAYKTLDRVIELARSGRDEASVKRFLDLRDELFEIDRARLQSEP